jgi:hypothetical protein
MRGLKRHRSARTVAAGHAFVQNLRRGHYDLATEHDARDRLAAAFTELAERLQKPLIMARPGPSAPSPGQRNRA